MVRWMVRRAGENRNSTGGFDRGWPYGRARLLLLQTNMPVIDVALACGFVSASHFSKCYRDFFGKTPRRERTVPLRAPVSKNQAAA